MKKLLDYSDYAKAEEIPGGLTYGSSFNTIGKEGFCPYCKIQCQYTEYEKENLYYWHLYRCDCGWWDLIHFDQDPYDPYLQYTYHTFEHQIRGILKSWAIEDKDLPLHVLNNYIKSKPELLLHIHHTKMEEHVQDVLKEHYSCEVKHVGKSGDGGIDLYVINKDGPIAIQVKRRRSLEKTEPVETVRSLIGAIQLSDITFKDATIVTTAHRFTKPAIKSAKISIEKGLVNNFNLIDFNSFVSMLGLAQGKTPEPWKKFM